MLRVPYRFFGFALGSVLGLANAFAQRYPSKPVPIIVPFGTGGGSDIQAR
jgi:tripartite-type tricarboxylate transporter receptor subunit TctC